MDQIMRTIGSIGYATIVALAITWGGIGISYLMAGRPRRTWVPFVVAMAAFAVLFYGLSIIATGAIGWFDPPLRTYAVRGASAIAALCGVVYTVHALYDEWRLK